MTAGLLLTITLVAFEALAVATVLPKVSDDLGGVALYGWVFSAFMLANLVGITVAGFQSDRRGPAPVLAAGLIVFSAGLTIAGAAPAMLVLVGGRALQGLGAGAMSAAIYVGVARGFSDEVRPRVFALMSTAWVVPGLVGPGVSAAVADAVTWRAVFFGLLPLVAIAGALTLPALGGLRADQPAPPVLAHAEDCLDAPRAESMGVTSRTSPVFDAVRLATGTALFLAGLGARPVLLMLALLAAGAAGAVPALRRLLPPRTLSGGPGLPSAIASRALLNFAFFGADAYVPLAIAADRRSTAAGGLALTAATLGWTAGSWVQERRSRTWPRRASVTTGLLLTLIAIIGEVLALRLPEGLVVAVGAWAVGGLGMGMAYQSLSLEVLANATEGREGEVTAALQLADVLGVALGAGMGGVAIAGGQHRHWDPTSGITIAFAVALAGGLLALLAARRLPSVATPRPVPEDVRRPSD